MKLFAVALLAPLALSFCKKDTPTANTSCKWTALYSKGIPDCLNDGSFSFGEPRYVVRPAPAGGLKIGQTITLKFSIIGDGKLVPTQGDGPAKLRLFIQQQGDTLTAAEADKRWWSPPTEIAPGEYTVSVVIDPATWINVMGWTGRKEQMAAALQSAGSIGFTFGGMFAGHGVVVKDGSARFKITDWSVR
jgi:hypothetical protein